MAKYTAKLELNERQYLLSLINKGKGSAKKLTHARIILAIDEGDGNNGKIRPLAEIAEQLHVSVKTIERVRKTLVEEGLDRALNRKKHSRVRKAIIHGEEEAKLIAIACSNPPPGQARWTLKLLAGRMVELEIVDSVSPTTVGRALKKTN